MLRKGTVAQLKSGELTREQAYLAVVMRHYPRGIAKELIDEYCSELSPPAALLKEFLATRKKLGPHNTAFQACGYERKFTLTHAAIDELRRLSELSAQRDVVLICQCALNERCHRELLLIAARRWFSARTELRAFSYPGWEARLTDTPGEILS